MPEELLGKAKNRLSQMIKAKLNEDKVDSMTDAFSFALVELSKELKLNGINNEFQLESDMA